MKKSTTYAPATRSRTRTTVGVVCLVGVVHFLVLAVIFTAASGWDEACNHLFQETRPDESLPNHIRGAGRSYYVDPGYTCEYTVGDQVLVLTKDMTGARNLTLAVTGLTLALLALAGQRYYRERKPPPIERRAVNQTN